MFTAKNPSICCEQLEKAVTKNLGPMEIDVTLKASHERQTHKVPSVKAQISSCAFFVVQVPPL